MIFTLLCFNHFHTRQSMLLWKCWYLNKKNIYKMIFTLNFSFVINRGINWMTFDMTSHIFHHNVLIRIDSIGNAQRNGKLCPIYQYIYDVIFVYWSMAQVVFVFMLKSIVARLNWNRNVFSAEKSLDSSKLYVLHSQYNKIKLTKKTVANDFGQFPNNFGNVIIIKIINIAVMSSLSSPEI